MKRPNFENPTWRTAAILKIVIAQISSANRPNLTKFAKQTQILIQATKKLKKSEIRKFRISVGRRIENHFLGSCI